MNVIVANDQAIVVLTDSMLSQKVPDGHGGWATRQLPDPHQKLFQIDEPCPLGKSAVFPPTYFRHIIGIDAHRQFSRIGGYGFSVCCIGAGGLVSG